MYSRLFVLYYALYEMLRLDNILERENMNSNPVYP